MGESSCEKQRGEGYFGGGGGGVVGEENQD